MAAGASELHGFQSLVLLSSVENVRPAFTGIRVHVPLKSASTAASLLW